MIIKGIDDRTDYVRCWKRYRLPLAPPFAVIFVFPYRTTTHSLPLHARGRRGVNQLKGHCTRPSFWGSPAASRP